MPAASRVNKKTAARIKGTTVADLAHHQLSRLGPGYQQANRCVLTAHVSFQSSLVGSGPCCSCPSGLFAGLNCLGVKSSRNHLNVSDHAQLPPPETPGDCNRRVEILPNRPTAQWGGGALH